MRACVRACVSHECVCLWVGICVTRLRVAHLPVGVCTCVALRVCMPYMHVYSCAGATDCVVIA